MFVDIASIVFVCVTMNHLGLIKAIEDRFCCKLEILNCPKCSSFWCVFVYSVICLRQFISPLAISFLSCYIAIWLELIEGYIDTLYLKLYGKITAENNDDKVASDS